MDLAKIHIRRPILRQCFRIESLILLDLLLENFQILVVSSDIRTHEEDVKFISQDDAGYHVLKELNIYVVGARESKLIEPHDAVLKAFSEYFDLEHYEIQLVLAYFCLIKYAQSVLIDK